MKIKDDQVDVRFFGQHDRAWVNVKECYLYSLEQPNAAPKRSANLNAAVEVRFYYSNVHSYCRNTVFMPFVILLGAQRAY